MGIRCVQCDILVPGDISSFEDHLRIKGHKPPFTCVIGDCQGVKRRVYEVKSSLIRHMQSSHSLRDCESDEARSSAPALLPVPEEAGIREEVPGTSSPCSSSFGLSLEDQLEVDVEEAEEDDNHPDVFTRDIQRAAALFTLDLSRRGNVTHTAVVSVAEEIPKFLNCVVEFVKKKVEQNLTPHSGKVLTKEIMETCLNVVVEDPFLRLKNKPARIVYYKKHFSYVPPDSKDLGYERFKNVWDSKSASFIPMKVPCRFQYVSVISTLTVLMNNPVFFKLIHREKKSTDGFIRSYLHGTVANTIPLLAEFPHTLRIVITGDDFECANAKGAKATLHKIVSMYYFIQNLPPEENARLRSIHLLAYAYREDLPKGNGVDALLEPFFHELQRLRSRDGVQITLNHMYHSGPYTLRATLVSGTADATATHEILRLLGSSANCFCAQCTVTRQALHADIFATGELRTKELHLQHLQAVATHGQIASSYYGVSRAASIKKNSEDAEFPSFMRDSMHDILRGFGAMEIKLSLHEFVHKLKLFDVAFLNFQLQSFNHGLADSKNKPTPNFSDKSLSTITSYTLRQSAAHTWCFLRVFPFLFGDKVPSDNPHMKMIVLLKRMCDIIYCPSVSEADLEVLDRLTFEHHSLFFSLYPPQAPNAQPQRNGDDEERVDDLDSSENEEAVPATPASVPKKKKNEKTIRPINKHHLAVEYVDLIRQYGPTALYSCMRVEGKHALPKRYAGICSTFQELPLTFAELHQLNHAAELMDMIEPVSEEVSYSPVIFISVDDVEESQALVSAGLTNHDVLQKLETVTLGGFTFQPNMYIHLPLIENNLPLFGRIVSLYKHCEEIFFITQDVTVVKYDVNFGAYVIQAPLSPITRAFAKSKVSISRPITVWKPYNSDVEYLSPRSNLNFDMRFTLEL